MARRGVPSAGAGAARAGPVSDGSPAARVGQLVDVVGLGFLEQFVAGQLSEQVRDIGAGGQAHAVDAEVRHAAHHGAADLGQQIAEGVQGDPGAHGEQDFVGHERRSAAGGAGDHEAAIVGEHGSGGLAATGAEDLDFGQAGQGA
jgi:hypothetical protein